MGFEWQRWKDIATVLIIFITRLLLRNQVSSCFVANDTLVRYYWLLFPMRIVGCFTFTFN